MSRGLLPGGLRRALPPQTRRPESPLPGPGLVPRCPLLIETAAGAQGQLRAPPTSATSLPRPGRVLPAWPTCSRGMPANPLENPCPRGLGLFTPGPQRPQRPVADLWLQASSWDRPQPSTLSLLVGNMKIPPPP